MSTFHRLLFVVCLIPMTVAAESLPSFPFLTVTGEAEMRVEPDKVDLEFRVLAFDKESANALQQVNRTAAYIHEFLLNEGVNKEQIRAYSISKDAKRNRHRESYQELEILGYQVQQLFKVELKRLDKFETIVNRLLNTNHVEGLNMNFDVQSRTKLETKLMAQAAKDAKQRAKLMASGMGVELLSVFAIFEDGRELAFNSGFDMSYRDRRVEAFSAKDGRQATFSLPQFVKLQRKLRVIYKIED